MKVLGIRWCEVTDQSADMLKFFVDMGMSPMDSQGDPEGQGCQGGVFLAGDSWVEVWQANANFPVGRMLQLVVDNADECATEMQARGLRPIGPTDAHGERIYFLQAPNGLNVSFQSRLN